MFAPLCSGLGCFAQGRLPTIMTSLRTRAGGYQRQRSGVSYSSMENIHTHTHPRHPRREASPFLKPAIRWQHIKSYKTSNEAPRKRKLKIQKRWGEKGRWLKEVEIL